jgi:mycothiol synthase
MEREMKGNTTVNEWENQIALPAIDGLRLRGYRGEAEIPRLAAVGQESRDADQIEFVETAEELARRFRHMDNFDPAQDIVVVEVKDKVIGFAYVNWTDESNGPRALRHTGYLLPAWRRMRIGQAMLAWAERRLSHTAAGLPDNRSELFHLFTADTEVGTRALLTANGYQLVRYSFEMVCPLIGDLPEIPLPEGFELRPAAPEHYRTVFEANNEAFEDHWGHVPLTESVMQWWMESPDFQPDLWKVAWDGDQVAGMVLNFIDHKENRKYDRKRGYTEDICVRRPWRRRGLARALIANSLQMFQEMGMQEAGLGVDTENPTGALRLYEGLGFNAVKRYTAFRKPLEREQTEGSKD